MLILFKLKNYKTFVNETTFSMIPAPKQKDLEYSVLHQSVGGNDIKALSGSVIYGPNAAGKTNIIGGIETLRTIVERGNIKNSEDITTPNTAMHKLELIPNNKLKSKAPVYFFIEFTLKNSLVKYEISLDLGDFLDTKYNRKVLLEKLNVNNHPVFERNESIKTFDSEFIPDPVKSNEHVIRQLITQSLKDDELFLSNGFKNIINHDLATEIINWFSEKLETVYSANAINISRSYNENKKVYYDKDINQIAKVFGACSNPIAFFSQDKTKNAELTTVVQRGKGAYLMPIEVFESYGTVRFLNLYPLIKSALATGGTLVIDEFDASIHPIALMNIVNIFHNNEINVNNAQLIFNTHNPIFLNSNIFRRDEIKFVERDEATEASVIYSLSDFGTSGKDGVRKTDDYMKKYFINQYGAIKDIDFSSFFNNNVSDVAENEADK